MPSPGRQRGGSKSGQSGPRGGGSKRGSAGGKRDGRRNPGKALRSKGVGWLRHSGTEEDLTKTNKELARERKTYTDKSGPVRTATKAQKARMQRTLDKQAGKKTRKMVKSKKSDASKTPGETKPKRTGLRSGGGTRLAPRIGGGPYKRTTLSQRIRDILE